MKACFPIVGEKEYKDSSLRTKQRQCVFTNLSVESVFISFVSFLFNTPHVSVPVRTSIRESKIRVRIKYRDKSVWKKYSLNSDYSCSKISCKHLGNIFKSGELNQRSVSSILEHTASDGKVYRTLITNNFFPQKHLAVSQKKYIFAYKD